MQAIAESAGVTKPVLYQHFASKEELYAAVVNVSAGHLAEITEKALANASSAKEQVTFGFAAIIDTFADDRAMFNVLFDTPLSAPDVHDAVAASQETLARGIGGHLQALAGDDPALQLLLGHAIVGMAENALRYWFRSEADLDVADVKTQLAELAWVGLRGSRPPV